ncbi:MAG TPA: beta-ketoacyl-[acyl-carrier-protein] synthase family protein [Gammaproteobacteria bacterium]|nr:beta-ketoacyl-[acyl-carrier-protein] synthase family protein [Gammaproteobacteria bacterium]
MTPLNVSAYTATNAAGEGKAALLQALEERRSGLRPFSDPGGLSACAGEIAGLDTPIATDPVNFDCRNHRLAERALDQDGFRGAVTDAIGRYGAGRIAVLAATSTSGIRETEDAYRHRAADGSLPAAFRFDTMHNMQALGAFVRLSLGLRGPCYTLSTACSSSAKAFASGARLIAAGIVDAAVVCGVDTLCRNTLYGFNSLELVSASPCRPCDRDRDGISIGEGAGFALLERGEPASGIRLIGYGESSDAFHMSSPHPEGRGAIGAMKAALKRAELDAPSVDYINLHGTASVVNDKIEDMAVMTVFGGSVPCSSTKGWTGHTLGAAGVTEAVIACLSLENGLIPGCLNTTAVDPAFKSRVVLENERRPVRRVMSNSLGFGGNNCSLIFGCPS